MKHILILFYLFVAFQLLGAKEIYTERLESLSLNAETELYDAKYNDMLFPDWNQQFSNYKVKNVVQLGFIKNQFPTIDGTINVTVEISYWTHNGSSFVQQQTTQQLTVNYSTIKTQEIDDIASFVFSNAHHIKAKITAINGETSFSTNLYLETSIEVERYYQMDDYVIDNNYGVAFSGISNENIKFYWPYHQGAEEYELEYTFVSNLDYNKFTDQTFEKNTILFDFFLNSTRLKINQNFYEIPAMFSRGFIVFRVRPIGRQGTDFTYRLEGDWNLISNGNSGAINQAHILRITQDYQQGKNWVHKVSYTENGKRNEVVDYVDGIGQTKQTISGNKENNQVIVSNFYYDEDARMYLSSAPTPQNGYQFNFRPNFNYFNVNGTATAINPSALVNPQNPCEYVAIPFMETSGTALYYSSNNVPNDGANSYIPDAKGFVYNRISYYDDPTGRVRESSGLGEELRMGNNHTVSVSYNNPDQHELSGVFGSEIGYSNQYLKTINKDENGQKQVNYTDLSGKLVASGLTGTSPGNLIKLDENNGYSPAVSTIYDGANDPDVNPLEEISEFVYNFGIVENSQNISFSHSFTPSEFTFSCFPPNFCFDCVYDLTIQVNQICPDGNVEWYNTTTPINGEALNTACSAAINNVNIQLSLPQGEYVLQKVLTLNTAVAENYFCENFDELTCIEGYSSIFNSLYDNTDIDCNTDIEGEPSQDPSSISSCDVKRAIMASHMRIGGQYGQIDPLHPDYRLSVYNQNNRLPNNANTTNNIDATWKFPENHYLNDDGSEARVYVELVNGQYSPAFTGSYLTDDNGSYVYPEQLINLSDFLTYYNNSWADALVIHHPEYCYLQYCYLTSDFESYRNTMLNTNNFDQACTSGLFNPLATQTGSFANIPGSLNTILYNCNDQVDNVYDEYFISGQYFQKQINAFIADNMPCENTFTYQASDRLVRFVQPDPINHPNDYLSLWQTALWANSDCSSQTDINLIRDCIETITLDECTKDAVWIYFRTEYLKLRQHAFNLAQTLYVSDIPRGQGCGPALNLCIGDDKFEHFEQIGCLDLSLYSDLASTGPCSDNLEDWYVNMDPVFTNNYNGTNNNIDLTNEISTFILESCEENCQLQADIWMLKLQDCQIATEALRQEMKADLINVCKKGCDENNMFGSTTVPDPSTNTGFDSFQDVIDFYSDNYPSNLCSDLLIDNPKPYGMNNTEDNISILDDCGCDKIEQARNDLSSGNFPAITTLREMLLHNTGVDIIDAESLSCVCQKAKDGQSTWNPTSLQTLENYAIDVPGVLSCSGNSCKTCSEVQAAKISFDALFPGLTETSQNYFVLFQNFMNKTLELNYNYFYYREFLNSCDPNTASTGCVLTPQSEAVSDMIDLLIRRGQWLNTVANPVDLTTDNVVYTISGLATMMQAPYYWSTQTGSQFTFNFGAVVGTPQYSITINIPTGLDLLDVIGIASFSAAGDCPSSNSLSIGLESVSCNLGTPGTRASTNVDATFTGFDLIQCFCSTGNQTLCVEASSVFIPNTCYQSELNAIINASRDELNSQIEGQRTAFIRTYMETCVASFDTEKIQKTDEQNTYALTLFYYDLSGNLIKTIAPNGVTSTGWQSAFNAMQANQVAPVGHTFKTEYTYNSYNQVTSSKNPDHLNLKTNYWYDYYGRLVASQNPHQLDGNVFTYTLYDEINRPIEVGQVNYTVFPTNEIISNDYGQSFASWINTQSRTEVTRTVYDRIFAPFVISLFSNVPRNLRLNVASVLYYETFDSNTDPLLDYQSAVHYSYDAHGNVVEQIQDVPLLRPIQQDIKSTQYHFDLISGNVNEVLYQEGERDLSIHQYYYDQMNRLETVEFSKDGVHYSQESHYYYHEYGPMARVEIGEHQVQGMDYAYTIQGWQKAMNASILEPTREMGKDGTLGYLNANNEIHQPFAKDALAYTLGYFGGDYKSISGNVIEANYNNTDFDLISPNQFNGNIRNLVTSLSQYRTLGSTYKFDQLYRLKETHSFFTGTNSWSNIHEDNQYKSSYSYDIVGNLKKLIRFGDNGHLQMDDLSYLYYNQTNRLFSVADGWTNANGYNDIKQGSYEFKYNKIGQLTDDPNNGIASYDWFYGSQKLKRIRRNATDLSAPQIEFVYNAFGQRILKIVKPRQQNGAVSTDEASWRYTYYSYDANNQVMAIYNLTMSPQHNEARLAEQTIYGASRIGTVSARKVLYLNNLALPQEGPVYSNILGEKRYELNNYLGNVNVVISDRKVPNTDVGANSLFEAVEFMKADYYAFGMEMPGRTLTVEDYRYGYQSQEVDNEIKGDGNSINYKYRMHDPRIGRFFCVDPLASKYPHNSPYAFSENRVIDGIELEGLEVFLIHGTEMSSAKKMFNEDAKEQFKRIGGNTLLDDKFSWGKYSSWGNSRNIERKEATKSLINHVVNYRTLLKMQGVDISKEPITLVGFSHGANLAIAAADEIERLTGMKVQIISYATPAYNDGSVEDPATKTSISKHIHLWTPADGVSGELTGDRTYKNKLTINYKLPNTVVKDFKGLGIETHSNLGNMNFNKELGNFMKNTIGSMKNLGNGIKNNSTEYNPRPKFENEATGVFNSQQ